MAEKERWYFDNWELTEGYIRDLESFDGTDQISAYAGTNVPIPRRGGEIWVPKVVGVGTIVLNIWLAATDRHEVNVKWAEIVRAVRRPHRLVEITRVMPDGEARWCHAELSGTVSPTFIGSEGIRAQLTFTVPAGHWRGYTNYLMQTDAGQLPAIVHLHELYPSTAPMDNLTCTITGPITNPIIVDITDEVDGDYVAYNGTIPAGQQLRYGLAEYEITGLNGFVPNLGAVVYNGSRLLTVPAARPGHPPRLDLRGSGGGPTTRLDVFGQRHYAT